MTRFVVPPWQPEPGCIPRKLPPPSFGPKQAWAPLSTPPPPSPHRSWRQWSAVRGLPASCLHRQSNPWAARQRNGDPRATRAGQGLLSTSPRVSSEMLQHHRNSRPRGCSKTEALGPLTMARWITPCPAWHPAGTQGHHRGWGMAFPNCGSKSQVCGHWSQLRGSWQFPEAAAQSTAHEGLPCLAPPWQPELGAPVTGAKDPGPAPSR